jgi:hypothetical protein
MSPVIVFLAFNTYEPPHDCFACFNRLGSVRYSTFQYTLNERNQFLEAKFGYGAVKAYENLIIKAQKEVDRERYLAQSEYHKRLTMVVAADGQHDSELERQYR